MQEPTPAQIFKTALHAAKIGFSDEYIYEFVFRLASLIISNENATLMDLSKLMAEFGDKLVVYDENKPLTDSEVAENRGAQELNEIDMTATFALSKLGVTMTGGGIIDKVELLIRSLSQNIEKRSELQRKVAELEQKLAQKEL